MIRRNPHEYQRRYNVETQNADQAITLLILDAIAEFPQTMGIAEYFFAYNLIAHSTEANAITFSQAKHAKIDKELAWSETATHHRAHNIGTDRPQFRQKEKPESPAISPKDKKWLADFVQSFLSRAVEIIRSEVISTTGVNPSVSAQKNEELLNQPHIRTLILTKLTPKYLEYVQEAESHKKQLRQQSQKKYGDIRNQYGDIVSEEE